MDRNWISTQVILRARTSKLLKSSVIELKKLFGDRLIETSSIQRDEVRGGYTTCMELFSYEEWA